MPNDDEAARDAAIELGRIEFDDPTFRLAVKGLDVARRNGNDTVPELSALIGTTLRGIRSFEAELTGLKAALDFAKKQIYEFPYRETASLEHRKETARNIVVEIERLEAGDGK